MYGATSVAIDSFYVLNSDTFLIPRLKMNGADPIRKCNQAYPHPANYSWIGRQVIRQANGMDVFIRETDSIFIDTKKENWICLTRDSEITEAIVAQTELLTWQNSFTDSVKLIRFRVKNLSNQIIADTSECASVLLSKHYGLLRLPGWNWQKGNPFIKSIEPLLEQSGSTNPAWGFRNKNALEMANYDTGDEFHHEYFYRNGNPNLNSTRIQTIYRVLSKTNFANDSIIYRISLYTTTLKTYPDSQVTHSLIDTFTLKVPGYPLPDYLGNGPADINPKNTLTLRTVNVDLWQNRMRKSPDEYTSYTKASFSDTCYTKMHLDGECIPATYVIEGIYGLFTECTGTTWNSYNRLVYYKKINAETWGQPLSVQSLPQLTYAVTVYPNPVTGNELMIYSENNKEMQVTLLDVSGREIQSFLIHSSNPVNVCGLKKGIYVLKITDEAQGRTSYQKLIRN